MTTDRTTATGGIARISAMTLAIGVALVVTGALVAGSAAAYGALVGTAIAVGIFGFGSFVVATVARVMPVASLLVALLTYTMQVVLLALVFVLIRDSGLLESTLDRYWLGGAILLGAGAWMVVQLRVSMTARIPAYDVPAGESDRAGSGAGSTAGPGTGSQPTQGGAR